MDDIPRILLVLEPDVATAGKAAAANYDVLKKAEPGLRIYSVPINSCIDSKNMGVR